MADTIKSIQLANGNAYTLDADLLDSHESSYFVDTATNQTVAGKKTFTGALTAADGIYGDIWKQYVVPQEQESSLSYIEHDSGNIYIYIPTMKIKDI